MLSREEKVGKLNALSGNTTLGTVSKCLEIHLLIYCLNLPPHAANYFKLGASILADACCILEN